MAITLEMSFEKYQAEFPPFCVDGKWGWRNHGPADPMLGTAIYESQERAEAVRDAHYKRFLRAPQWYGR